MIKLQTIRLERGLTQAQLAEASGVNLRILQQYESGKNNINNAAAIRLYKLSKVLGCSIEDLLEDEIRKDEE